MSSFVVIAKKNIHNHLKNLNILLVFSTIYQYERDFLLVYCSKHNLNRLNIEAIFCGVQPQQLVRSLVRGSPRLPVDAPSLMFALKSLHISYFPLTI